MKPVPVRWAAWILSLGALAVACTATPDLDFGGGSPDGGGDDAGTDGTVQGDGSPGAEGGADVTPSDASSDTLAPPKDAGRDGDAETPPILDAGPDAITPCGPVVDAGSPTVVGCCPNATPTYCVDQACQHCSSDCQTCTKGQFCCPVFNNGGVYKGATCKPTPGC